MGSKASLFDRGVNLIKAKVALAQEEVDAQRAALASKAPAPAPAPRQHIRIVREGAKVTNLTVNGNKVDPNSPEGKAAIAKADPVSVLNVPQSAAEADNFRRYLMVHPKDAKVAAGLRVWDEAHPLGSSKEG